MLILKRRAKRFISYFHVKQKICRFRLFSFFIYIGVAAACLLQLIPVLRNFSLIAGVPSSKHVTSVLSLGNCSIKTPISRPETFLLFFSPLFRKVFNRKTKVFGLQNNLRTSVQNRTSKRHLSKYKFVLWKTYYKDISNKLTPKIAQNSHFCLTVGTGTLWPAVPAFFEQHRLVHDLHH